MVGLNLFQVIPFISANSFLTNYILEMQGQEDDCPELTSSGSTTPELPNPHSGREPFSCARDGSELDSPVYVAT